MKTNAIIRIALYSLSIVILLSILLGILCFNTFISDGRIHFDGDKRDESPVESMQRNFTGTQIKNIKIDWVSGTITIRKDEKTDDIRITEYSHGKSDHQLTCSQSGKTLEVHFSEEPIRFFAFGNNDVVSKDLLITVPANWEFDSLEIDAAASEVKIHDLAIDELDFDGASGTLFIDNCSIRELDIDTASGDVEFSGSLRKLDFDAATAKFYGKFLNTPDRLTLDTMSGDMEMILPENSGFTLDLDAMSSSFDSDFIFSTYDDTYICGDGDCKISVSAMSGDVHILKGATN